MTMTMTTAMNETRRDESDASCRGSGFPAATAAAPETNSAREPDAEAPERHVPVPEERDGILRGETATETLEDSDAGDAGDAGGADESATLEGDLVGAVDETRIKPYDAVEAGLAELQARANEHRDLATKEGMRDAKLFVRDLTKLRGRLKSCRKGARAFFMQYVARVDARAEEILQRILAIQEPLKQQIADYEAEQERIRIEKETLRRNREEAIRRLMEPLQRAVIEMAGKDAAAIRERIQVIQAMKAAEEIEDQNIVQAWLSARNETLRNLATQLLAAEAAEKLRIEAQRREERMQRLQSAIQALGAPVVLASQCTTPEAMQAQQAAMDAVLNAIHDEDPSFMAQVQDAHRNGKTQIESMIVALRAKIEQEARLKLEREQFERERAQLLSAQAELARKQAEMEAQIAAAAKAAEEAALKAKTEAEAKAKAEAEAEAKAKAEAEAKEAGIAAEAAAAKAKADADAQAVLISTQAAQNFETAREALVRAEAEARAHAAQEKAAREKAHGRTPAAVLDRLDVILDMRAGNDEVRMLLEAMAASFIRGDDTEAGRLLRRVLELDAQYLEQQGVA